MKLKKKFLYFASAVVFVLLVLNALLLFCIGNEKRIHQQNHEYLEDAASQLSQNVDAAITEGFDNIRIVSNLVSQTLTSPKIDLLKLREIMEESIFDFVEFADTGGNDHTVIGTITDARDREYYLKGVKEGRTGLEIIYNSRATHETLLMFYAPVFFEKRIVGSVIGVYQASKKMSKLLTVDYFGEPATAYLATRTGRLVASNLKLNPAEELYLWDMVPEKGFTREIKNAVAVGMPWSSPLDHKIECAYMAKLPQSGWFLMQFFPEKANEKMVDAAYALGFRLVAALLLIYAILFAIALVSARTRHKRDVVNRLILEDALDQAKSANRAKTTFLNSMSHDIRTPMNAVIGYTGLAKRHIDDKEMVLDYLKKIGVSSAHLLSLINDVLDMSRIESGKLSLNERPENLLDIVRAVESIVQADVQAKRLDFQVKFVSFVHENVLCDRLRLSQVLLNILSNSIKYTPEEGSVQMTVEEKCSCREKVCALTISIKDTGYGMSEDFLKVIFEPFTRMENSTISGIQGTGLGMTITKSIVDMMGGTIDVKSKVGEGTQITIDVDFNIFDEPQESVAKSSSEKKPVKENSVLKGKKILLVEDNEMNREIAMDLLEEAGFVVYSADNGTDAVEKVKNAKPGDIDLILMDVQMPVMNGYEATQKIRALKNGYGNIPIIAMTANVFDEDRKMALDAGMNDHASKPIDVESLKSTIAKLLI